MEERLRKNFGNAFEENAEYVATLTERERIIHLQQEGGSRHSLMTLVREPQDFIRRVRSEGRQEPE